jgi:5-methylthioadenosine/S-adenosylhomocysteine deaminase
VLLTGATVVTINPRRDVLADAAIHVVGDRIAAVGPTAEVRAAARGDDELDCRDRIVIPGLVNTHTHLFQTLLKGLGDDMVLKDWFTCMTGPSAAALTPNDCHAAALHGCAEAISTGTTTLVDFMYVHPQPSLADAVLDAFDETGMRGIVARGCITSGEELGVPSGLVEDLGDVLHDARRLIPSRNVPGARVRVGLAPCMIWTVDEATLRQTRALADETGAPVTIHVSETNFEIEQSIARFGLRDLPYLESIGFLGPDVLAVHCVQCDERDIATLAQHDVKVSHNPCSNLYLASGVAPIPDMTAAGVTVGLATDGPASNNNHNLIHALKLAALVHKGHRRDATIITAEQVLEMATIGGAAAIGLDHEIGSIEVGKKADLAVLRADNLCITPLHHPVSALVYSAIGDETEHVLIDGKLVLRDGQLTTIDAATTRRQSQTAADSLAARAGTSGLRDRPWRRTNPGASQPTIDNTTRSRYERSR